MDQMGQSLENAADAPRTIELRRITNCDRDNDFIAIKLGDLNGSVFIQATSGEILNGVPNRNR